jgi:hypothetical protein
LQIGKQRRGIQPSFTYFRFRFFPSFGNQFIR